MEIKSLGDLCGLCVDRGRKVRRLTTVALVAGVLIVSAHAQQPLPSPPQQPPPIEPGFRFRSGVELINVTATVSDASGRFVPGLRQEDFLVYEDDQPVTVTHFNAERVPVSLGIALDTSGSMGGQKIQEAEDALGRFLFELLDKDDQMFLYRFSSRPTLLQGWTRDRQLLTRALGRITPNGGTAMYDTVAEAIPLAQRGENRKKALLVISDGNDTSSATDIRDVKAQIRESEVLVYAIGIDGEGDSSRNSAAAEAARADSCSDALSGRTRRPWLLSAAATDRRRWRRQRLDTRIERRPRQRDRAARHDRRQRRPHRDHPRPARSHHRDHQHRRRAQ